MQGVFPLSPVVTLAKRLLLAALLAVVASPAGAQASAGSVERRAAQFVLVLDDSGSMRQTDPDRLAVFAAQSLLSVLDDQDEVSVVRLNGPVEGEAPPPIALLARSRQEIAGRLRLDGTLAGYTGKDTTCRSALSDVRRLLDAAYRPNVVQVVLFLTDGACMPASERPDPAGFLAGLRSHEERLFQFYLLHFRGESVSPELPALAERTGGETVEVDRADPTSVLHGFATALSRAQGYESALLSPADARIAAHRGARRVRLLAVAPGESPPLALAVHDGQGRPALALGQPRRGVHRFASGHPFRFVALDYKPGTEPVTVQVTGAGDSWRAVVLPEYRLSLDLSIREGACATGGRPVSGLETGATACLVLALLDERGVPVGTDALGRDLEATVLANRADRPGEAASELPAEPEGTQARFHLQRNHLEAGEWVFQPSVSLRLGSSERPVRLLGRRQLLQVASNTVIPVPAHLDLGTVRPGEEVTRALVFQGNFRSTPARLTLTGRKEVPSCLTVELSGKPEGTDQPIVPGQPYTVALRVAPYCGPRSFDLPLVTRLHLEFKQPSGGGFVPPVEVPLQLRLAYRIEPPGQVVVRLRGGESRPVPVAIGGNRIRDLAFETKLAVPGDAARWPGEDLKLSVTGAGGRGEPAGSAQAGSFVLPRAGGVPLTLRAEAGRCCPGGTYETSLSLAPARRDGYSPAAPPPAPLVVPVRVVAESAGWLACWGPRLLLVLAVLLLAALVLYGVNMVRHSHFLSPERVAEKLVPLAWTAGGGTADQPGSREAVLQMVRRELRWPRRLQAWLKANPLAFGLSGSYRESLELFLTPNRDASSAVLTPERDFPERLRREPASFRGRLFAVAQGSVSFLGVPDPSRRLCQLALEGAPPPASRPGKPEEPEVLSLRGQRILRRPEAWERRQGPAGWRVG